MIKSWTETKVSLKSLNGTPISNESTLTHKKNIFDFYFFFTKFNWTIGKFKICWKVVDLFCDEQIETFNFNRIIKDQNSHLCIFGYLIFSII